MLGYKVSLGRMLCDAERIRKENLSGKIPIPGIYGIYYFASSKKQYVEAPINIVISKDRLMKIKERRYVVAPQKIEVE